MLLLIENYESGANPWLRRLLDTRSIFIMPNANALGYHDNVRTENGLDPNRDFPYGKSRYHYRARTMKRAGPHSHARTDACYFFKKYFKNVRSNHSFFGCVVLTNNDDAVHGGNPTHPC